MTIEKLKSEAAGSPIAVLALGVSTSTGSVAERVPRLAGNIISVNRAPSGFAGITLSNSPHFRWRRYLTMMEQCGKLTSIVSKSARDLWTFVLDRVSTVDVPHAGPTPDGGFIMVWDRGPHHIELEALPSGRYDWFYRNRESEEYEGGENLPVGDYPRELLNRIRSIWPDPAGQSLTDVVAAGA